MARDRLDRLPGPGLLLRRVLSEDGQGGEQEAQLQEGAGRGGEDEVEGKGIESSEKEGEKEERGGGEEEEEEGDEGGGEEEEEELFHFRSSRRRRSFLSFPFRFFSSFF